MAPILPNISDILMAIALFSDRNKPVFYHTDFNFIFEFKCFANFCDKIQKMYEKNLKFLEVITSKPLDIIQQQLSLKHAQPNRKSSVY